MTSAHPATWMDIFHPVVHVLFKSLQVVALPVALGSFAYYRYIKPAPDAYERFLLAMDKSMKFGFPAVAAAGLLYLYMSKERYPTRADRLRRNWRQGLLDYDMVVGILVAGLLPGSNNNGLGKFGLGVAMGTGVYLMSVPRLPYDSKDWIKDLPPHPELQDLR